MATLRGNDVHIQHQLLEGSESNRMRGKPPIARPWRSQSQSGWPLESIAGHRAAMLPARGLRELPQPRARASQSTSELKVRRDASARPLRTRIILLRRAHPLRGVHDEPSTGVKVCEI